MVVESREVVDVQLIEGVGVIKRNLAGEVAVAVGVDVDLVARGRSLGVVDGGDDEVVELVVRGGLLEGLGFSGDEVLEGGGEGELGEGWARLVLGVDDDEQVLHLVAFLVPLHAGDDGGVLVHHGDRVAFD